MIYLEVYLGTKLVYPTKQIISNRKWQKDKIKYSWGLVEDGN